MISVVQRVSKASVTVEAEGYESGISAGLCVLLAIEKGDTDADADWMAGKLAHLRLFPDEHRNMNRSVQDVHGAVLLISQFTLAGNTDRGNRPGFDGAAEPAHGRALYERVGRCLGNEHALPVEYGMFGASMRVALVNEGPVTLIVRK